MTSDQKIRVAVLFGGRSAEHEVSLRSAANVIQYLDKSRFEVVPIGIDREGNWFLGKDVFMQSIEHHMVPKSLEYATWFTPEWIGRPAEVKENFPKLHGLQFDVVFPALHGTYCEDGTLQGLLELANVPYVGCGVLASSIGMDKDVSKRLALCAGIDVASYLVIKHNEWLREPDKYIQDVAEQLQYPVFVKPANTGSSIGINKIKHVNQLSAAIDEAFKFDSKVLIEKALDILELELAVLESLEKGQAPIVSVVGQIKSNHEFYSYDAKYIDEKGAELVIPAEISDEIKHQSQIMAQKLFRILECEGMARVDLFFDKQSQKVLFNEINTLPGFTQISMYPKLLEATGISYSNLLTHLINLAMQRHQRKQQITHTYAE